MKTLFVIVFLATVLRVQAEMNWAVYKKVTGFNQTLTLYCQLGERCKETAGWVKWVSNSNFETLIFSVKEKSFDEHSKYDGRIGENGFYLMIRNVSKKDFGVNYSCTYGIDISSPKLLASADAFIGTGEPIITKSLVAKTMDECDRKTLVHDIVYPVVIGIMLGVVVLLSVWSYRLKQENNRLNSIANVSVSVGNLNEDVPSYGENTNAAEQILMRDSSENSNNSHQSLQSNQENVNLLDIRSTVTVVNNETEDDNGVIGDNWKEGSTAEGRLGSHIANDDQNHASQKVLFERDYTFPKTFTSMRSTSSCNSNGYVTSSDGTRELRHDDSFSLSQQATNKAHEHMYKDTSLRIADSSIDGETIQNVYPVLNTEPAKIEDFNRSGQVSIESGSMDGILLD